MSTTTQRPRITTPPPWDGEEGMCFHHSIPRALVHRAAISEVFLTDSRPHDGGVLMAAQLPRNHAYFSDHRGTSTNYDSLLLVEVFRQVAIYYAHRYRGVSEQEKFVFTGAEYRIREVEALRIGQAPGHCVVLAELTDEVHRGQELAGLSLTMTAYVDGVEAAQETMRYQWLPREAWQKIRRRARTELMLPEQHALPAPSRRLRLRPEAVGRTNPRNSILADPSCDGSGQFAALVIVDTDHPSLFDHALDHVPGMLQFEAFRQGAMAATSARYGIDTSRLIMTELAVNFSRFGELELDTHVVVDDVEAVDSHTYQASVRLVQQTACISEGRVGLTVCEFDARTMLR